MKQLCVILLLGSAAQSATKVWEENIVIPTYLAGDPEPNPIFNLGRNSQGAQGIVYPYPLYDILLHKKVDKNYKIVYLENEYIKIGILPEIGGRLFEGVDKTNGYNFIYRQHVIKPALIGLIGAWISGGIEWNIPHHHRASTFLPVQYRIEEDPDGTKTVWVGELEIRHRTRWAVGYTLQPGKSYFEARVRILNRTPVSNTMLCFANVAVHVNENYQVIFPPSTQHGTFHGKREFLDWPVAHTKYAGADFTKGVDVSWYKNHSLANSIFAWNYSDDFFAGYDHGKHAGTMAIADHNVVPGKKVWTWGNGPRGRMWDHILTDEDGPYDELMVGAYSDNQPDYSWLQPFDVKTFSIRWYPFRDLGGVKNANMDAAVNLDIDNNGHAKVGFYTTSAHPSATVLLQAKGKTLFEETVSIDPSRPFLKEMTLPAGLDQHDLRASISVEGRELVSYSPLRLEQEPTPSPVKSPPPPAEVRTVEELYLIGLRAEQFHDPRIDSEPYWSEALRRDPGDARVNTALGIRYFKQARLEEAERLFRKAVESLTANYTTPKDAEPVYYLGLTLKAEGKYDEAYKYLYLATWNLNWRAAGYYGVAEIACMRGDFARALDFLDRSLDHNALNIRALNLKSAVLRHLDRPSEALDVLATARRRTDPLDVRSMAELWLASKADGALHELTSSMDENPATAVETAAEYMNAGLWHDGTDVLMQVAGKHPFTDYYLGYFAEKMGQVAKASEYYTAAAKMSPAYGFPFQCEMIDVFRAAMKANPRDARAPYYLGNLLFDWQPEEASRLWELSARIDPAFPIVHRNLAIASAYKQHPASIEDAIRHLETAVSLTPKYARHFAELDDLYRAAGTDPGKRLALLEQNQDVVSARDDSLAHEIGLLVSVGKYDEAIQRLTGREFSVWEGANLDVAGDWTEAHILRGRERLSGGKPKDALADFQAALQIPSNLPSEGVEVSDREPEVEYWIGEAYRAIGKPDEARTHWRKSAGSQPGAHDYYRACSLRALGQTEQANMIFRDLITRAGQVGHYNAALGYLGLNDTAKARDELTKALKERPDNAGARFALQRL